MHEFVILGCPAVGGKFLRLEVCSKISESIATAHLGTFQMSSLLGESLSFILRRRRLESLHHFQIRERLRELDLVRGRQVSARGRIRAEECFQVHVVFIDGLHPLLGVGFGELTYDHLVVRKLVRGYGPRFRREIALWRGRHHRVILVHFGIEGVLGRLHHV